MANKLKEYNRKRDFTKTQEPSGKEVKSKKKKLVFVVQEHHASHLHYDFRLELDGVLKSWAVPKGPSLDPADKRLAVQTEDHPMGYEKFHGTIPKGEYGGGEVFIWDNGTWEPVDKDPSAAIEKGRLEFKVKGKKLNGKFILIRTNYKGSQTKKNWLLIKRHDEAQIPEKKVKAKLKVSGQDPWPGFVPPQLPRLVTSPPEDETGWIHEMKHDGYRMQCHIRKGIAHLYTRNGLDWSNSFPFILEGMGGLHVEDAIIDGEIVALNEKGASDFQKLQNSLKAKNDKQLRFYAFDLLYLNGRDLRPLLLLERKGFLEGILKKSSKLLVYSEHFTEQGKDFYKVSCEHQLEGIISKMADSPYRSGRNDLWMKAKCGARQEFVIGGWSDPKGGRTGIGSLLLGVYEGNELRYAGRVGTGFDNKTLRELKKMLTPLSSETTHFDINSPKGKDIHWVQPEKVCEVSFANWTEEGILRAPVFQGLREDKPAPEILHEKPKEIKKAAKDKKRKEISSPEKVLFKAEGITKKQVADFYQAIAPHMLPYLKERPLSLVRCPHGSEGHCFFQKHFVGNVPDALHTFPVTEEKGEGIYISIDSVDGLLELVQLNAFEIHAWNCHKDDYMRPDQIVMDFDPGPGVEWEQVVNGAFELKEMLEDLGLKSFVKMTGGKGLHVHVPIAPLYDWDQIKSFTQSLAMELVSRHPELYTANMAKKLRTNKIFVDYLRNGYGATAVVPYSLRARPTSAIALPVDWKELRKIKGPQDFTLAKALKKIKARKSDPWNGMLKLKQKIQILKPQKKAA
ncbi:MAG TPA: DNA ligase D [Bacteriovoracaceae bacterium]|nr:DNA ligase D [Bacteriovoracaceae bacterium]